MLRVLCVATFCAAAAFGQSLSPLQAMRQELSKLAEALPGNICPFGPPNSIVSPGRRLMNPPPPAANTFLSRITQPAPQPTRCFLPGLAAEARVMNERISTSDIEQVRALRRVGWQPAG